MDQNILECCLCVKQFHSTLYCLEFLMWAHIQILNHTEGGWGALGYCVSCAITCCLVLLYSQAWHAKRANDEPKYIRYKKWACNLAGIPIFVIMAVLFVVIVVVAVTLDNARQQTV